MRFANSQTTTLLGTTVVVASVVVTFRNYLIYRSDFINLHCYSKLNNTAMRPISLMRGSAVRITHTQICMRDYLATD